MLTKQLTDQLADQGRLDALLTDLAALGERELVALAEYGRAGEQPPAFAGRSLEPTFLAAVASGAWSLADEERLSYANARAEALALPRVPRRYRRGLRSALHATTLSVCTQALPIAGWGDRVSRLASAWEAVVGPLPERRRRPRPIEQ